MSKNCLLFLGLCAMLAIGCKKKTDDVKMVLSTPVAADNKIILSWTPSTNERLQGYLVYRITDSLNKASAEVFEVHRDTTTYTDYGAPSPYVQYYVAEKVGGNPYTQSNRQVYKYSNINFEELTPMGAIVDKDTGYAYVYSESGNIQQYMLEIRQSAGEILSNIKIGHPCLGVFLGRQCLFVPRADGEVYVYHTRTLAKVDQIHIGTPIHSVSYNNGILFVAEAGANNVVASYDVFSHERISAQINSDKQRLAALPGTNTTVVGMSTFGTFNRYNFDADGVYVDRSSSGLATGPLMIWSNIMELFPGSGKMIASAEGVVVKETGGVETKLYRGEQFFTSFDINPVEQRIYASCTTQLIHAYTTSGYGFLGAIVTRGYPVKVYRYLDKVYSISTSAPTVSNNKLNTQRMYTFIEQVQ